MLEVIVGCSSIYASTQFDELETRVSRKQFIFTCLDTKLMEKLEKKMSFQVCHNVFTYLTEN